MHEYFISRGRLFVNKGALLENKDGLFGKVMVMTQKLNSEF